MTHLFRPGSARLAVLAALIAMQLGCSGSSTTQGATSGGAAAATTSTGGSTASSASSSSTGSTTSSSSSTSSGTTSSSTTSGSSTSTSGGTRTLDALSSPSGVVVNTGLAPHTGTCDVLVRDTSSCQAARTALGLSGNWLRFSCNVELGLATAAQAATTDINNATYVSIAFQNLPDFKSNYYPTTGSYSFVANGVTVTGDFSALYQSFTTSFPDPGLIAQKPMTMYVPLAPQAAASQSQGTMGVVGVSLEGIGLLDSHAGGTDNIFSESGSFDECGGHPNNAGYHYHSEPYSTSYDDDALIGVMRDGYFIYGRRDSDGSTPGDLAHQVAGGTGPDNLIYIYGGHTGAAPSADDTSAFHYHLTEWKGCFDEVFQGGPPTKASDDGAVYDSAGTFNTPANTTCNGTWIDAWFLTGHGNGGVYAQVPSGIGTQSPAQSVAAQRFYYGTPGPCTGCAGH